MGTKLDMVLVIGLLVFSIYAVIGVEYPHTSIQKVGIIQEHHIINKKVISKKVTDLNFYNTTKKNMTYRFMIYNFQGHTRLMEIKTTSIENKILLHEPIKKLYYYKLENPVLTKTINTDIDIPTEDIQLNKLVYQIQSITPNKNKQALIAISLVQNIPYNYNLSATDNRYRSNLREMYPFQVLFYGEGVCGSKSELLVYLLKQLGFGTAIFYFKQENHMGVGIKINKSGYENTGYAYIETTDVSPPFYNRKHIITVGYPTVAVISHGINYNN